MANRTQGRGGCNSAGLSEEGVVGEAVPFTGGMAMELFNKDSMNAPWGLESRLKLAMLACDFFKVRNIVANSALIGKEVPKSGNPPPLTGADFRKHLDATGAFQKSPNALRVVQILERMASAGILLSVGSSGRSVGGIDASYIYVRTEWDAARGLFRFVPVLGPEFLYRICAPGLVQITGRSEAGDVVAGTGLVVHPSFVLTCAHVVRDMKVDAEQTFQGRQYRLNGDSVFPHPSVDLAVIGVDGAEMSPLKGAVFQQPVVAQTVYALGYPKLPGLREAAVTIQQGAVTNESVTSLKGEHLFLYSAVSRPGNSGGPVLSEDGYVVGISIVDSTAEYHPDEAFSPHYAGIPAQVAVEAVGDIGLSLKLPFESYE